MSQLNVNAINSADGTDDTLVINAQNTAKVIWHYDQTTPALRSSFNVDSISDDALGIYTVTFTTNMADTLYAGIVSPPCDISVSHNLCN